jgi:hypothetical protein
LGELYFAIDSNNQLVQVSESLEIKQTGMRATTICANDKQLFVYLDDAISIYTWQGRLQLSCKLSGANKQPAFLKPWYTDESITELSYQKVVEPQVEVGQKLQQIRLVTVGTT